MRGTGKLDQCEIMNNAHHKTAAHFLSAYLMVVLFSCVSQDIWKKPETPFIRVRVMDLLFDGVSVDCTSQEFGAKAVCTAFEDAPQLRRVDDDTFKFSFFTAVSLFLL